MSEIIQLREEKYQARTIPAAKIKPIISIMRTFSLITLNEILSILTLRQNRNYTIEIKHPIKPTNRDITSSVI